MADIPQYLQPNAPVETPVPVANVAAPGTVPLMSLESKAVIHVPITDVDVAVRSGNYAPLADSDFHVTDESGEVSTVKGQHLNEVLNAGYTLENPTDTHHREVVQKYGDSALRTFGEAAASSATFGGSDLLARGSGVPAEDLAGREEANPVASTLGTIAGFVPGLFTGATEASIAKTAIKAVGTPARAMMKASQAVEKATAHVLKQGAAAGVEKSVLKSISAKMAAGGAGGLVEGSFLGAGQLIHEAALGTADFNAENLVSHVTLGGLIGGAFGATVAGGIAGLGAVGKKASHLADATLGAEVAKFTNKELAAFEIAGFTPSQVVKMEQRRPGFGSELVKFMEKDVGLQAMDSAEALSAKLNSLKQEAGVGIGQAVEAADMVAQNAPGIKLNNGELKRELAEKIQTEFLSKEALSTEAKMQQAGVRKYYEQLILDADRSQFVNVSELQKMRQAADELAKLEKVPGAKSPTQEAATMARNFYAEKLRGAVKAASEWAGDASLYENFTRNNKLYSMASEVQPKLASKLAKSEHLNPLVTAGLGIGAGVLTTQDLDGAALGGIAALAGARFLKSDIRRNLVVLGKIEKAQQAVGKAMDSAVKNFFNPSVKILEPSVLKTLQQHELGKDANGKKPKDMSQAYQNFRKQMDFYQQNPEKFLEKVNRSTSLMYTAAPNTMSATDSTAVRAMMFLGSKMPKQKSKPGVLDILKQPKMPSNFDLAKFHRYLTAVDDPKSVIKDLETGKISREGVEALGTVYPTLFNKLRDKIIDRLQTGGDTLTYNKRVQLGMLFGLAADDSMLPESVLSLQANFQTEPEQSDAGAPVIRPSNKGMEELGVAERAQTSTERVAKGDLG